MTRDDITRMAREAGFVGFDGDNGSLRRFAALVAAHALVEPCCQQFDKCQKVCMPRAAAKEREAILQMSATTWFKTQADYDAAIRARWQA